MRNIALASALLVIASAAPARADFCLSTGFATWVGKGFRIPPKGKCKPWNGFLVTTASSIPRVGSGTACRSSTDGSTHLSLQFTDVRPLIQLVFLDAIELPAPPATTGTYTEFAMAPGSPMSQFSSTLQVVPCAPKSVPVP